MFEGLFRLLFKYPPLVFEQGAWTVGASRSGLLVALLAVACAGAALVTYRSVSGQHSGRERAVLISLRLAVLAIFVFCLFRPALILKASVPQQNFVGVLVDDSRSM